MARSSGGSTGYSHLVGRIKGHPLMWQTSADWPGKNKRPSMYLRSGPGHPLIRGYSTPPAPRSFNWGAFLPERLEYQDVQQRPLPLTKAYCQCLQHWAEKVYLPTSPDACPLAESIRELCQAMSEFVTITKQDILEGLEMERPIDSHWLPLWLYSAGCWVPQPRDKRKHLLLLEFPGRIGC